MLVRILFGFLVAAVAVLAGEAEASSIVAMGPLSTKLGPSMIQLGASPSVAILGSATPEPGKGKLSYPYPGEATADSAPMFQPEPFRISASIIAMGEPPVAMEQVAAIDPEPKSREHDALPLVIRGGVLGDAFTRSAVPVSANAQQQAASSAPSSPKMPDPAPEPVAPAPASTPSPPTRQPE